MSETFYEVLGVAPDASTSEIEAAYRERLKETHPDHSDAADAEEATKRVIEARDVLTDDAERERYDRLGHEAYVADDSSPVDRSGDGTAGGGSDVSDAAAAAREASERRESGPTNDRAGPYERRRRERKARERVDFGDAGSGTGRAGGRRSAAGAGSAAATGPGTSTGSDRGRSADAGTAYADSFWDQTGGAGGSGRGYEYATDRTLRQRLVPTGQSLTLLGLAFLLYPVMLFSALFPHFPLFVNAIVAICTLLLVGYLQSIPGVGTLVFGAWSLIATGAVVAFGVEVVSVVGVAALAGTWVPFGLSALTLWLLSP
ncbi:J domain-containing protein [Halomicrobium salinisoli]|uniref:J domain-containing protein n=1 Tax=Halomicrobium salinisoli TaxID=2878391 RepID=UPI001CF0A1A0|nr:DnaJ domain-containing protein [Halomicrobium salinisoli]